MRTIRSEKEIPGGQEPAGGTPHRDDLRQRIGERAYGLYLNRGRAAGHDVDDWLEAERLVIEETRPRPAVESATLKRQGLSARAVRGGHSSARN